MAGLNLNPKKEETAFQTNDIELLLERICKKTYLMPTGWEIIRQLYYREEHQPTKSSCKFEAVDLNENFTFTRPLTVTGAYLFPEEVDNGITYPAEVLFHQMVLDRVDDSTDEYVVQKTSFDIGGPVLRIPKTRAYYVTGDVMLKNSYGPGEYKFYGKKGEFMWLANERFGNTMQPKTWYLLPQAYSITLVPEPTVIQQNINPPQQPLVSIQQPVAQHPQHPAHHQQHRHGHAGLHQVQSRQIKKDEHSSERPSRESSEARGKKRRAKSPQMQEETTERNAAENHEI